jgi:membrane protease YdiL (CAAX protease family)
MRKFMSSHPILIVCLTFVIGVAGILFLPNGDTYLSRLPARVILSIIMLAIMVAVGGWQVIRPSGRGIGYAVAAFVIPLLITLATVVYASIRIGAGRASFAPDWVSVCLIGIVYAFFVGLFEETMFRGVLLNGILAKTKGKRLGIFAAVVIVSILFGFMHIIDVFIGGVPNWAAFLSAATRVFNTAASGMLFAAIYLKTQNIWAVVTVHGLNDAFAFIGDSLIDSNSVYALPALDDAIAMTSKIQPALSAVMVVIAVVILLRIKLPRRGFFER